jgi:tetratricopeptide (TPR) repeat protein
MAETDKCFVVMPFGVKPKNDGTNGTYNFDKVYRVIIQRAISNVNMKPLRADETEGNRIVHADMFKDLRDRPVVLADLSLLNPNVMYELGIRHVMSSTGTVLMANEETVKKLPFDIALSRTISYKYDGENLDWDEVERVIPQLQAAIEEARRGSPDSPVYAFLEQVLSPSVTKDNDVSQSEDHKPSADLDEYQKQIAQIWLEQKDVSLAQLLDENSSSFFGVRCVGYYALLGPLDRESLSKVAGFTFNHEQYDLSTKLYELLEKSSELTKRELVWYSQAVANAYPDLQGAARGLKINEKARALAKKRMDDDPNDLQATTDYSHLTQQVAEMLKWIWSISRDKVDLENAIKEYREAIRWMEELRAKNVAVPVGRYAQNLICYAMFLRIAENDPDRPDVEKNFQKVLALKAGPEEPYVSVSHLRWYQIFILADMGKYEDVQKRATSAISEDIKYASKWGTSQIGRRQYSKLREFLEQYSRYWRDTTSIARVPQILNSARLG